MVDSDAQARKKKHANNASSAAPVNNDSTNKEDKADDTPAPPAPKAPKPSSSIIDTDSLLDACKELNKFLETNPKTKQIIEGMRSLQWKMITAPFRLLRWGASVTVGALASTLYGAAKKYYEGYMERQNKDNVNQLPNEDQASLYDELPGESNSVEMQAIKKTDVQKGPTVSEQPNAMVLQPLADTPKPHTEAVVQSVVEPKSTPAPGAVVAPETAADHSDVDPLGGHTVKPK